MKDNRKHFSQMLFIEFSFHFLKITRISNCIINYPESPDDILNSGGAVIVNSTQIILCSKLNLSKGNNTLN